MQTSLQEMTANNRQVCAPAEADSMSAIDVSSIALAAKLQERQMKRGSFDVDEIVIKPKCREVIQQRAEFMKAHGSIVITLEGRVDGRGSSEYNLVLGDKCVNVVRKSLQVMSVQNGQVKTVSLGEEHPKLTCHEEQQCWKENRRVDFTGKKSL